MSKFIGDFAAGDTIDFKFTTYRPSTGAPFTLAGTPVISVYKDNNTTQKVESSALTVDFDSVTGLNHVRISTGSDGTFYSNTGQFEVVITTGTVDSVSVVGACVGRFTLAAQTNKALTSSVTVGTNNDKTGYSLTQSFPTNFSSLAITAGGAVTAGTVSDKTGYSLSAGSITSGTFGSGAITNSVLASGAISNSTFASDAIGTSTIASGAITSSSFGANAITASALATDAAQEIADAVWDEPMSGHTTNDTYGNSVLRSYNNSNAYLKTTGAGAGHVGADVHEMQNDVVTAAALADSAGQDIADQILGRNIAGGSSTGRLVKDSLRFLRNRFTLVGDVLTVYAEDDTTIAWTAVVSTDGTALPITGSNPAGGAA